MWQSWQRMPAALYGPSCVVAGAAHLGGALEGAARRLVDRALAPVARTDLHLARLEDEVEVERHVAREAHHRVADVAGDALVGTAAGGGPGGRDVAGEEGERCVAADAAGLDAGHLCHLLGVRQRQAEVLDLVPVVGVALRHHRLLVLAGDVDVAHRAVIGRLEVVVSVGAERGVAGRGDVLGRGFGLRGWRGIGDGAGGEQGAEDDGGGEEGGGEQPGGGHGETSCSG